jgi:hypothetical protein
MIEVKNHEWLSMDEKGYRTYLTDREHPIPDEEIELAIPLVKRFEEHAKAAGKSLGSATAVEVTSFVKMLIDEGINTYQSLVALSRYGYFIKNINLYLAILELVDGAEVMNVLHERIAEMAGSEVRDKILPESGLPPLGLPSVEKIEETKTILGKMQKELEPEICRKILSEVAHGLPRDFREGEREKFLKAGSIDKYLEQKRKESIEDLEQHRDDGSLFFNMYVTDEIVEFVKSRPDVLTGERRGNVIYHTKIPYMPQEYLHEADERMKRYYACHCAWARESILTDDVVSSDFCHCSGGFTKMPWEAALDQPLEYEMVKSVLKGDTECAFIIHLPPDVT